MKTDEEIKKTFKVFVDENSLFNLVFFSPEYEENNTRQAELVRVDCLNILNSDPAKQYNVLVDITKLGEAGAVSGKAQEIYRELAAHRQMKRIAIIGVSDIRSKVLGFIIKLIGLLSRKMSWFSNREEAMLWLQNE